MRPSSGFPVLPVFLAVAVPAWATWAVLARRYGPPARAAAVAAAHLLFVTPQVVAPFRSWLDPGYIGYQLGALRFEGREASLPALAVVVWGMVSAWLILAGARGPVMLIPMVGDLFFAAVIGGALLGPGWRRATFQLGEYYRVQGPGVALAFLLLAVAPFVLSAWWIGRQRLRP